MTANEPKISKILRGAEAFYLALLSLSFYLLIASRVVEAHTVSEVMNPLFIPIFFSATFILVNILLSSDKVEVKLLFVILHSIILHSFFSIIFPAGDASGQQMYLGRIRFAFDSVAVGEWAQQSITSVQSLIFQLFKGTNFQASLSTVLSRLFGVDIFWTHLFLVPVLWSVFTTNAAYLITKNLGTNETAAVLSSLLVSAFPYTVYFGAISVPTSLGLIFAFYSLYFTLRHLSSKEPNNTYWMLVFSFFSFLAHYLTGIISFSLILLGHALKTHREEKKPRSITTRTSIVVVFLLCASLLPLSFIYLRFFGSNVNTIFTLDKFYELPVEEILRLFLVGELAYASDPKTVFLFIIGPAFALLYMTYLLYRFKRYSNARFHAVFLFLFAAFLLVLVDYRILKLFMSGIPINEERLWVFRDFIAAPFVALAIYEIASRISTFLKSSGSAVMPIVSLKSLGRRSSFRVASLMVIVNVFLPLVLAGWIIGSLNVAYPQIAPLQITGYELEAARYIKDRTTEDYVVIGDEWTVYAGEMVVGVFNSHAYYFSEYDRRRQDLFTRMLNESSPPIMLEAMNTTGTRTTLAYFIITEPRVGAAEYNRVIQQAQQNGLPTYPGGIFYYKGEEKLRIFYYKKTTD